MGAAARLRYEREFTAARNHQMLLAIYDDVIGERRRRGRPVASPDRA